MMLNQQIAIAARKAIRETMGVDVSEATAELVADRLVLGLAGAVEFRPQCAHDFQPQATGHVGDVETWCVRCGARP
jgi:hypothetical protein